MDQQELNKLKEIAKHQRVNSLRYADARKKAGEAEADLKLMLAPVLKGLREEKKNLGVEMATLLFIADNPTAKELYDVWQKQTAIYKGLEKILDAYGSTLITEQSIMKYIGQGERWGA